MKTFETFAKWNQAQSAAHKRIISKLRKLVAEVAPQLEESSKWGNGVWLKGELPIIYIHTEKDHLQFGFFVGALLADPKKVLRGSGKYVRHIRIESASDLDEAIIASMVRKAVKAPPYK
ncbi:DUF1801 domain-containing protein [Bdellovibrio sp. HCB290]|uniref:DUF1801 domain-containing protein n=1 Tax=Bdellovibrio sp. HCB290 TaxID=3394356 RepID=UPI0039B42F78